ncbi:MAG: DUF4124 domain-containing protein [Methylococcales bacterium]|nr:DUF4124 domain-containing protein [Methylococcales bacterium]MBT7410143.1 DUF4124 domain-containing protein [Methylococcales bacterium]
MTISKNKWLFILFCSLFHWQANAGVYKWVDKNGQVHFGDRTTSQKAKKVQINQTWSDKSNSGNDYKKRLEKQKKLLQSFSTERLKRKAVELKKKDKVKRLKRTCYNMKDSLRVKENAGFLYDLDENGKRVVLSKTERKMSMEKSRKRYSKKCRRFIK